MYSDLTPQPSMWEDSVGTLTENRACGLVHFNLIHTTCIRYMYLYFFRELCLRVGMFLCVFILLLGFSLFLSLFDVSFFLSFFSFLFFSFLFFFFFQWAKVFDGRGSENLTKRQ